MLVTTNAPTVSSIWSPLDKVKEDLYAVSQEQGVSEVLLLTLLKDFCERRLVSVIDDGR
jgi:hypothetical protein